MPRNRLLIKAKARKPPHHDCRNDHIANLSVYLWELLLVPCFSWRATFLLVGIWELLIRYYIWRWVPHVEGFQDTGFRRAVPFSKTRPMVDSLRHSLRKRRYSVGIATQLLLTNVSGFSVESITLLMIPFCWFQAVMGNLISGRLPTVTPPSRKGGELPQC